MRVCLRIEYCCCSGYIAHQPFRLIHLVDFVHTTNIDGSFTTDDKRFTGLADRISLQIFRINSNVTGIQKLVDTLGSKRDNGELRQRL